MTCPTLTLCKLTASQVSDSGVDGWRTLVIVSVHKPHVPCNGTRSQRRCITFLGLGVVKLIYAADWDLRFMDSHYISWLENCTSTKLLYHINLIGVVTFIVSSSKMTWLYNVQTSSADRLHRHCLLTAGPRALSPAPRLGSPETQSRACLWGPMQSAHELLMVSIVNCACKPALVCNWPVHGQCDS